MNPLLYRTFWLQRLPLLLAAVLLLRASWLPLIEVKAFDTFALATTAQWATHVLRVALAAGLACLLWRSLTVARWWLALAVGIGFGSLVDTLTGALTVAQLLPGRIQGNIMELIIVRQGAWFLGAGLACWGLDLLLAAFAMSRRPAPI